MVYAHGKKSILAQTKLPNKACTGLVGTVRLLEHCQRPEVFSARRASQRPAHKPSNARRWAAGIQSQ
jgi:hypothetical protein